MHVKICIQSEFTDELHSMVLKYFDTFPHILFSSLAVDCKTVVADCHEPLKGCIDCWKDPTADICTNECLTGPGPCFYKNDVDVATCVKDNHKKVAECAVNKDKSLVTANHCLSCHCA